MRIPLSPHGSKELALAAVAAAAGTAAGWWVSRIVGGPPLAMAIGAVWAILFGYVCSFFRDPERRAPDAPGLLAPADGTVADIQEVDEPEFVKARCLRIGIFLSIFNCHVNRAPIAGTVAWLSHREGKFHDARSPLAATENESNWIGLDTAEGRLAVKQISGKIARRIVCPLKLGDAVARGQRLGLIKFGSRTELYVPLALGYAAAVRVGETVCGSVTLLATRAAGAVAGRA